MEAQTTEHLDLLRLKQENEQDLAQANEEIAQLKETLANMEQAWKEARADQNTRRVVLRVQGCEYIDAQIEIPATSREVYVCSTEKIYVDGSWRHPIAGTAVYSSERECWLYPNSTQRWPLEVTFWLHLKQRTSLPEAPVQPKDENGKVLLPC